MSSQTLFVCLAAVALITAGCGKKETAAPSPAAPAAPMAPAEPTAPAAPAAPVAPAVPPTGVAAAEPRVIEITANDAMKFSVTRIEAKAGETLTLVLNNVGRMPKETMGHNLIVLKAGVNDAEYAAAAIGAGPARGYFPPDRAEQTIAHTPIIGPRTKAEITFTLPAEPAEYVYVCTFPGHYAVGMKGVIVAQ